MTRVILLFVALLAGFLSRPAQAQDWRLVDANAISPGAYIVLTIPTDTPETLTAVAAALSEDYDIPLTAEWPLNSISVLCLVYDASASPDIEALLTALRLDTRVRTAQRVRGYSVSSSQGARSLLPAQWAMHRMNVLAAHAASTGAGVRVGIVDSAIDRTHPDLSHRMADTRDFVSVIATQQAEDHGTAVAGVIGADAQQTGLLGVAPGSEMVGLRACWQTDTGGQCNSFSLARAVNFAILNGIDVLNMSLGGPDDPLLTELIEAAMAKDMVVVAAAGETEETVFPASLPGVIAAGRAGPGRIPAPMTDILSTAPGESHRYVSGSSIATAHVSGVAALVLAGNPDMPTADVGPRLLSAVDDAPQGPMLDACRAVLGKECAE
ncbi:S8 family peptidase [Thalassobius sp. S69A]|uniref:S8 family peptidase n=1 Tax=unclassified Thalassovita TaxID=2619711 RepID=UPI000C0CC4A2|nr:serine protease [Paracoccaceae bacterium]MBT27090.1 serine protease [Paracoccaceae bacterium]